MESDVTVLIPAFNRQEMIGRAVSSALNQTVRPKVVIVVDDGSTDATAQVATAAGALVIRQDNAGPGPARNTGVQSADTAWVAFLDSDDEWLPNHLEVLLSAVTDAGSPSDSVIVASGVVAMPSRRYIGPASPGISVLRDPTAVLFPTSPFAPSATMVNRAALIAVGGFTSDPHCEDLDAWVRLIERGPGVLTDQVTCRYHEHTGQISVDNRQLRYARLAIYRRYAERSWAQVGLEPKLRAGLAWDDFRVGLRVRDRSQALTSLWVLVRTGPVGVLGLSELLRWRRQLRRRAITLAQFDDAG